MLSKFKFGSKNIFLAQKFKYLILFRMKYSRISSNFGAKIQICLKVRFVKIEFLVQFEIFILSQNLDFRHENSNYIFETSLKMKYSRIPSNFGAKIQTCLKVGFCQNWIVLEFCTVVRCFESIDESSSSWLGSDPSMPWCHRWLVLV